MSKALELIQNIFEHSKGTKNINNAVSATETSLIEFKALTGLELTYNEVWVYCWLVQFSIDESDTNTLSEVVKHLDAKRVDVLEVFSILERLYKLKYVQRSNYRNTEDQQPRISELRYYVGFPAINALSSNKIYLTELKQIKVNSNVDFIKKAQRFFNDRDYLNIDQYQLESNLIELFKANRHLKLVNSIESLYAEVGFDLNDTTNFKDCHDVSDNCILTPFIQYAVILELIFKAMESDFKFTINETLFHITNEPSELTYDFDYLNNENHPLTKGGFIQKLNQGGIYSETKHFQFNNTFLNHFLGNDAKGLIKITNNSLLIMPEDIKPKELFFNRELEEQLKHITRVVSVDKFDEISNNLANKFNSNPGVCILLEGSPGTGKTEFALQVARNSGRSIYQVDLSQTRGSFMGESEKNVKQIFNNYYAFSKFSPNSPILFINEADGFFGRRFSNITQSSEQVMNNVQAILLNELENFTGLLILSTNLPESFDPSFERRILFKVKFENPNTDVRSKIWKYKMKDLEEEKCNYLAESYQMSPAQIDNVAKKIMFKEILNEEVNMGVIIECCEAELGNKNRTSVGFKFSNH